jgi:hypothetical protein
MNWRIPPVGTWGGTSLLLAALSLPLFATAQSVAAPWQGCAPWDGGDALALVQAL